ncbi:MAG: prolipoprotein diacylglyceryl transferase [Clostridia bacterium]|nr:prolipoprotein diacylglyceryl transferase [Clostridia bacterium]
MTNVISFPGLGIGPFEVNEIAFKIFGLSVHWYGLIIMCGMLFCVLYVYHHWKKEGWNPDYFFDVALSAIAIGVIGARIYYIVFSLDNYIVTGGSFWSNVGQTLKNMISVWNGGLAIYGGLIFGALAIFLVARWRKIPVLRLLDIVAPSVALAQAIGRWGNFVNAEAYGGPTNLPWRMGITYGSNTYYFHPTFLYESLWNILGFILLNQLRKKKKYDGQVLLAYAAWYGFGRMLIEGLRTDSLMWGPFRVSQILAAILFVGCMAWMIVIYARQKKAETQECERVFAEIDSGVYGAEAVSEPEAANEEGENENGNTN